MGWVWFGGLGALALCSGLAAWCICIMRRQAMQLQQYKLELARSPDRAVTVVPVERAAVVDFFPERVPELVEVDGGEFRGLSPYQQALELVRQGVATPDIVRRCGISRSEIELLVVVYRRMG